MNTIMIEIKERVVSDIARYTEFQNEFSPRDPQFFYYEGIITEARRILDYFRERGAE